MFISIAMKWQVGVQLVDLGLFGAIDFIDVAVENEL